MAAKAPRKMNAAAHAPSEKPTVSNSRVTHSSSESLASLASTSSSRSEPGNREV